MPPNRGTTDPRLLILTEPRQVGKTTFMRSPQAAAQGKGTKTRSLDLEQPTDRAMLPGDDKEIIEAMVYGVDLVLADEFYYLANQGREFKAIFDLGALAGHRTKVVAIGHTHVPSRRAPP